MAQWPNIEPDASLCSTQVGPGLGSYFILCVFMLKDVECSGQVFNPMLVAEVIDEKIL